MGIGPFSLTNIQELAANPRAVLGAVDYLGEQINIQFYNFRSHDGLDVVEEDWDNLIILDGCRYDTFRSVNWIEGELSYKKSPGSESLEYIESSFLNKVLHDIVYTTANPYAKEIPDGTFHILINLLEEKWDDDLNTVTPQVVAEQALQVYEEYKNKRHIIHFMQPHYPFIGDIGQKIDNSAITPEGRDHHSTQPWRRLRYRDPEVNMEDIISAYRENLRIVLEEVEKLVSSMDGKTVITSDHGNLIGDRLSPVPTRGHGHPRGLYVEELITVPWLEISSSERREIKSDPPQHDTDRLSSQNVNERLKALGYQ